MAKIRFWKWQHTDELGLPRFTRFPISDRNRREADEPAQGAWPLDARTPALPNELMRRPPPQ